MRCRHRQTLTLAASDDFWCSQGMKRECGIDFAQSHHISIYVVTLIGTRITSRTFAQIKKLKYVVSNRNARNNGVYRLSTMALGEKRKGKRRNSEARKRGKEKRERKSEAREKGCRLWNELNVDSHSMRPIGDARILHVTKIQQNVMRSFCRISLFASQMRVQRKVCSPHFHTFFFSLSFTRFVYDLANVLSAGST